MLRVLQGVFLLEFGISWYFLVFTYKTLTFFLSGFLLLEEAQSEIVLFGKLLVLFLLFGIVSSYNMLIMTVLKKIKL